MSNIQGLMRHTKRELCDMILKYEAACDDIQGAVVELLKENENLKLEAEADSVADLGCELDIGGNVISIIN